MKHLLRGNLNLPARRKQRDGGSAIAAWSPLILSPSLWLDASVTSSVVVSGGVMAWSDLSGNNKHAIQTTEASRPGYTSGISVNFDGTNDYLTSPLNINGWAGITVFWVVKPNNTNSQILDLGYGQSNGVKGILGVTGSTIWGFDGRPQAGDYINNRFTGTNTNKILGFGSYDLTNTRASYNGGTPQLSAVSSASIQAGTNTNIGGLIAPSFQVYNNSQEHEILVFQGVLSTDNKQKVEGYLAWKWDAISGNTNLVDALPSDHPYKNSAPTV